MSSRYYYVSACAYIPYPCERGPTTEYRPTPQFGLNFLLRSNVHLNMRPCVAALEKRSSNGWFMGTELQIIEVRSIDNLPNSCRTKPMPMPCFRTKERSCTASNRNHTHLKRLPSTAHRPDSQPPSLLIGNHA